MAAATAGYPDLEAPAAGQRRAGAGASRIPSWARAVFMRFPLYEWPEAEVHDSTRNAAPSKPILYVAPGHPRPQRSAAPNAPSRGWASADPRCLRWQMSLLFREVDFETEQLPATQSWGPGPHSQLPFLQLCPSTQAEIASVPGLSAWTGSLIAARDLPIVTTALGSPESRSRNLKGKDTAVAGADVSIDAEAETWTSLLETTVLAGVLLKSLLLPAVTSQLQRGGLLSQALHSHLTAQQAQLELKRIDALSPGQAAWSGARGAGGGAGFRVSALWSAVTGALAGVSINGTTIGGDAPEEDPALAGASAANVDADAVLARAAEALEAFAVRVCAAAGAGRDGADAEKSAQIEGWLLGRSLPGELDAVAFALLHTILSLPVDKGAGSSTALRKVVERHSPLLAWTRRIWTTYVQPRGG